MKRLSIALVILLALGGLAGAQMGKSGGGGDMFKKDNLSGLASKATARANLGDGNASHVFRGDGTMSAVTGAGLGDMLEADWADGGLISTDKGGTELDSSACTTGAYVDSGVWGCDNATKARRLLGGVITSSGNAATATALAADPSNCAAGQVALGVNASGTAECTATPSITAATVTDNVSVGTSSSLTGKYRLKNATNAFIFDIISGVSGSDLSWTTPTAAPGGANYLLNVDTDGTMGYTDPSTLGGGDGNDTEINRLAAAVKASAASPVAATTFNGHTLTAGSSTFTGTAGQTYTFPSATSTLLSTTGNGLGLTGFSSAITGIPVVSEFSTGKLTQAFTVLNPPSADGAALGSSAMEWADLYLADGGVIYGQNNQSATLTSSASTWTASNLVSTGTFSAGAGAFIVDSDGDVTAKSFTSTKVTDTASIMTLYNDNGTQTVGFSWKGPHQTTAQAADFQWQVPTGEPAAGQCMVAGTVASNTTTAAWFTPQSVLTNSAGLRGALNDETGTGVAVFGTGPAIDAPIVTSAEVDCHADGNMTVAQVSGTVVTNYDQADGNATCILPTAARGMNALFTVATARAKTYGVQAKSTDKIYLLASAGTIADGEDHGKAVMVNAQVGQQFVCYTFKTGATDYDWACKAIAIGTSTFEAR